MVGAAVVTTKGPTVTSSLSEMVSSVTKKSILIPAMGFKKSFTIGESNGNKGTGPILTAKFTGWCQENRKVLILKFESTSAIGKDFWSGLVEICG